MEAGNLPLRSSYPIAVDLTLQSFAAKILSLKPSEAYSATVLGSIT